MPRLADPDLRLRNDDRCWEISELTEAVPNLGVRRIQRVYVMQDDDRLLEYRLDLGPAAGFSGQPFRILSLGEDSVGACLEQAERQRHDDYWQRFLAERQDASTLIPDFLKQVEERWDVINNRSVLGPSVRKQRNGFNKRAARESYGRLRNPR